MVISKTKKLIFLILSTLFNTKAGKFIFGKISQLSMTTSKDIIYGNCKLKFAVPNWITRFRADTFAT